MEMLCPECMGTLEPQGPDRCKCPLCGADFDVLFSRSEGAVAAPIAQATSPPPPPPPPPPTDRPSADAAIRTKCPSCGKAIRAKAEFAGRQGRCPSCGEAFRVPEAPEPPQIALQADGDTEAPSATMCKQHPSVPAVHACARCEAPICATCGFPQPDGTQVCPDCMVAPAGPGPRPRVAVASPSVSLGMTCRHHPTVAATHLCSGCSAPICNTCAFAFPGGVHMCPACATKPSRPLSGKRKKRVGWALGLAIWATLGSALILTGVAAPEMRSEEDVRAFGTAIWFLIVVPCIVGAALGMSCVERRLANPPIVWVVAVWNGIMLSGWVLLMIIGAVSGG